MAIATLAIVPAALTSNCLQAVVGPSLRLRDEMVAELLNGWSGPVKRTSEPDDLQRLVLDLDTPSLFEEPALWLVRAGPVYLRRHRELLAGLTERQASAGRMMLVVPELDRREALAKALIKAKALHECDGPDARSVVDWLSARLSIHPQGVERPRQVAEEMAQHLGADCDALLNALDVMATYAGDQPITVAAAKALLSGTAEEPIWEFTGAFCEGNAKRAIELFHAGGAEAERTLAALNNELRKLAACCDSSDDAEANAWAGGRGNLYYARKRAKDLGRAAILRLMNGAYQAQRQLRQSGFGAELVVETLVLHAQRVIKGGRR